jgi:hypothetical protein
MTAVAITNLSRKYKNRTNAGQKKIPVKSMRSWKICTALVKFFYELLEIRLQLDVLVIQYY